MSDLDWTKPIEAYHADGRIMAVERSCGPDHEGDYGVCPAPNGRDCFHADGSRWKSDDGWRIRNRKPAKVEVDAVVWERCVGLVRKMSEAQDKAVLCGYSAGDPESPDHYPEAREIAKLLPVEVDPDWEVAGNICADMGFGKKPWNKRGSENKECIKNSSQDAAYAAIKRGRELERNNGKT
jgi:hypothetical protein